MQTDIRLTFEHSFKVSSVTTSQGNVLRPILPVTLSYGDNKVAVNAMVDTGADFSMFDRSIARSLKILDKELMLDQVTTLQGKVPTWYCPLTITFMGKDFECRCAFVDNPDWPPVVGRDTIFSRAKFAFRQAARQFYISFQP